MGRRESVVDENIKTIFSSEDLENGLSRLLDKIQDKYGKTGWHAQEFGFDSALPSDGFQCIDQKRKC